MWKLIFHTLAGLVLVILQLMVLQARPVVTGGMIITFGAWLMIVFMVRELIIDDLVNHGLLKSPRAVMLGIRLLLYCFIYYCMGWMLLILRQVSSGGLQVNEQILLMVWMAIVVMLREGSVALGNAFVSATEEAFDMQEL